MNSKFKNDKYLVLHCKIAKLQFYNCIQKDRKRPNTLLGGLKRRKQKEVFFERGLRRMDCPFQPAAEQSTKIASPDILTLH